jgi:hypothetical protein
MAGGDWDNAVSGKRDLELLLCDQDRGQRAGSVWRLVLDRCP